LLWRICHGEDAYSLSNRSAADSYQVSQSVNLLYGRTTSEDYSNMAGATPLFGAVSATRKNSSLARPPSLRMPAAHFIKNFLRCLCLRRSCRILRLSIIAFCRGCLVRVCNCRWRCGCSGSATWSR
jgi:hypothetical protein